MIESRTTVYGTGEESGEAHLEGMKHERRDCLISRNGISRQPTGEEMGHEQKS